MSKRSYEKRKRERGKKKTKKRGRAYTSLSQLSTMKPKKREVTKDNCNVCNRNGVLTFDHVPPKATRKIIQENSHWLTDKDILVENWDDDTVVQKLGFKTVCEECNGISSGYIDEYNEMIIQLLEHISNQGINNQTVKITINPLIVFKQILYMFLVQNNEFKIYNYHKYLYNLFQTRNAICDNLDSLMRIYMGFHAGHNLAYHPDTGAHNKIIPDKPIVLSKENPTHITHVDISQFRKAIDKGVFDNSILFPPFYYRLIIRDDLTQDSDIDGLIDITPFSTIPDQIGEISFSFVEHTINLPPSSFRSSLVKHTTETNLKQIS